jgi:hypothetical protein
VPSVIYAVNNAECCYIESHCAECRGTTEKSCQGQNTLAYLSGKSMTKKKSLMALAPGLVDDSRQRCRPLPNPIKKLLK